MEFTAHFLCLLIDPLSRFEQRRGKFFVSSFRGSRRRRIRVPDIASFGYDLGSSPLLQGSMLRSTARQLIRIRLRLREDFLAFARGPFHERVFYEGAALRD